MFTKRQARAMFGKLAVTGAVAALGVVNPGCSVTKGLHDSKAVQGVEKTAYNVETKAKIIEAKAHKSVHDHVDSIRTKVRQRLLAE
jgi:hypothetical protein